MTYEEEKALVIVEFEDNTWITETACHKAWESACERARLLQLRLDAYKRAAGEVRRGLHDLGITSLEP
jgi:hypothetical protein